MQLVFSDQPIPSSVTRSIFLAGPSPREKSVIDWRIEALNELRDLGFDGEVFIPIPEARFHGGDDSKDWTYDNQIGWECAARHVADKIVFWVPRDIAHGMPAFTTNVEFGEDLHSGKMVYGRPDSAEKCRYLDKRAAGIGLTVHTELRALLNAAITELGEGATRQDGEVHVPLFVWRTPQFQSWYANLKAAGNRLDNATLLHQFSPAKGFLFSFVMSVSVWVEAEQRHKTNEFIFSRPSICTVLAHHTDQDGKTRVVLIKEFRSPVSNQAGYAWELPGGSTTAANVDPLTVAQHELEEETGISIADTSRFKFCGEAQLAATLSTHTAHLYQVKLTDEEFAVAQSYAESGQTFGVDGDSEQTTVVITDLQDIANLPLDFSMLGMIFSALR